MKSVRVLIISSLEDSHAVRVASRLAARGAEPTLLDMSGFPKNVGATFSAGRETGWRASLDGVELRRTDVVWWRRPAASTPQPQYFLFDPDFVQTECDHYLEGLLWSLPVTWVNDPAKENRAARKLVQLSTAVGLGLAIPQTLVTTDPVQAREFLAAVAGPVITKRIGTTRGLATSTLIIGRQEEERLASLEGCPTILQEYIRPAGDIRVVVMDRRLYAFWIDSPAGANPVDSRVDMRVSHTPYQLPASLERQLHELLTDLGLICAVIDLRMSTTGEIFFLEVNPSGQWDYLEAFTGEPLTDVMAETLIELATGGV